MTNTLHSINEYDYTGQSNFVAPSHQQASDIVVLVNDVVKTQGTDYTLTGSLVAFTGFTPSNGDKISIRRETASAARPVDFASGSMLKAETLDQDSNQIFNIAQEALDKAEMIGGDYNARYYGATTTAPTSPAPEEGDLWFDTATNVMKVRSASAWISMALTEAGQAAINSVVGISAAVQTAAANATGINHYGRTFLGSDTVAPSTYSDGTAIQIGAFWFDSSVNTLKVYQANGWQNAALGITNPINRKSFTAATGQTTFPMSYESGHVDVYLNGVKLVASTFDSAPPADSNGNVTVTLRLAGKPNATGIWIHSNLWNWVDTYPTPAGTQTMWSEGEATQEANGDWVWTYQVPAGTNFQYEWYHENATEAGLEDLEDLEDTGCNDDFFNSGYSARVYRMDITDTWESCNLVGSGLVAPAANDYTASNGTSVVLTSAAAAGDLIDIVADNISPVTQVVTGAAGTDASYNLVTGIMTIPRGDAGIGVNTEILDVTSTGIEVTGTATIGDMADVSASDAPLGIKADSSHRAIALQANGTNSTVKFNVLDNGTFSVGTAATTNLTLTSSGDLNVTGDIEGRDVAYDGSKLDTIEPAADITDTANVTAAGAAMLTGATFTGDVHIESTLPRLYLTDTNNNSDYSIINTDGKFSIYDDSAGVYRTVIDSSGNMGIGTSSPAYTLDIESASPIIKLEDTDTNTQMLLNASSGVGGFNFEFDSTSVASAPYAAFKMSGSEAMRIDSSGNVGIGTDSPATALDVNGELAIRGGEGVDDARMYFRASDNSNRFTIETDLDATTSNDILGFRSTSTDNILTLKGDGRVGIGTSSPNYEAHIHEATADADARIQLTNADTGTGTGDGFHIIMNGTTAGKQVNLLNREASPLALWTSNTERMRIDSSGNVGINTGTNSISEKLDVVGNIAVSGTVDGRDVAADGTKLDGIERTVRQRFQKRGYSSTVYINSLTSTLQQCGDSLRINSGVTTDVENVLDLNITANFLDVNSSNEGEFVITVDAPNPSDETTINLGTVVTSSMSIFKVAGDFTKHFSPYCGMSTNSDGSNGFAFDQYQSWWYDPTTDRTTVKFNPYQNNTPLVGDTVYLHPFDWETSGTEINGETYPMEAYNAHSTVTQNHFHQIYLGYYKPERTFKIKAREITSSESIQITKVAGTYSQIIGG